MNNRRVAIICLLFSLLLDPMWADAFSADEDFLWIEFTKCIKEKDGAVTLPLEIHYGRFPDYKGRIGALDSVRVFYAPIKKAREEDAVFYEANIVKKDSGECTVNIQSLKTGSFLVIVNGIKQDAETTYSYSAKTSFILFGHSLANESENDLMSLGEISRQFEMLVTPKVAYWPQTGDPIRIVCSFNRAEVYSNVVYIFDEHDGSTKAKTDDAGVCTYVPPHDRKLNWAGDTAFKQTIAVAEEIRGNTNYVSSYTLFFHRSRFQNHRSFLGVGLFLAATAGFGLAVDKKRKRFEY